MTAEDLPLSRQPSRKKGAAAAGDGRVAIVDIGSNTVRLVVYDALTRLPVPIFNERVACGLGRGLAKTGRLNEAGIQLAATTLTRFSSLVDEMSVDRVELLATAAVREAEDGTEFAHRVERQFGRPVTILTGSEEARLGAEGVLSGLPKADGLLGDMGGGSLDLVSINAGAFGESATLPMGHLRLAEESNGDVEKARTIVNHAFDGLPWLSDFKGRVAYAVGGAWRALARIAIEQDKYPLHVLDGYRLSLDEAKDLTGVLSSLSKRSIDRMSGISKRRAETMPFAALAMHLLLVRSRPSELIFSGYSIREGKLFEMLTDDMRAEDPLISACEGFARRSGRFSVHGQEVVDWMAPLFPNSSDEDTRLRLAAALLSDIGWPEHPDYRALHAFLRVLRIPIAGMTHRERVMLAMAVFIRYDGKRSQYEVSQVRPLLTEEDDNRANTLGLALRLAHVLSGGVAGLLERAPLKLTRSTVTLKLSPDQGLFYSEAVEKLFMELAKALGVRGRIS